jgi:hypothetical protein
MQQGRVQLDADWNDQVLLAREQLRRLTADLAGPGAAPAGAPGYAITPVVAVALGPAAAVVVDGADDLVLAPSRTFEVDVRVDAPGTLLSCGPDLGSGYRLAVDDAGDLVLGWVADEPHVYVARAGLPAPPWRRFVRLTVVFTTDTATVYADGRRVGHAGLGGAPRLAPAPLVLGDLGGDGAVALAGNLRLWAAAVPPGTDAEPDAWWPLDDGHGAVAADRAGRHAGRLAGEARWHVADLDVGAGRYYVHGVPVSLAESVRYSAQPSRPRPPERPGRYLFFLDVWERTVSAVEDPGLREVALGGPDTTVRVETVAEVRHLPLGDDGTDLDGALAAYDTTTGRMRAGHTGYTAPGNHLYRVEVHRGGSTSGGEPPALRWSRTNGSTVVALAARARGAATVETAGGPPLARGDLVEYVDDTLRGRPGPLYEVADVSYDASSVTLAAVPDGALGTDPAAHPFLRVWEGGPVPVEPDTWVGLEDGIEVSFEAGSYRAGDYWLVAARQDLGGVVWPDEHGHPVARPPDGVARLRAPLALVTLTERDVVVDDLRVVLAATGSPSPAAPPVPRPSRGRPPAVVAPFGDPPAGYRGTGQVVVTESRWTDVRTLLSHAGPLAAVVPYGADLLVVAGCEVWLAGPPRRLTRLPQPRTGFGCCATDSGLLVAGGVAGESDRPDGAVLRYDVEAGTWSDGAPMPYPVRDAAVVRAGGEVHVLGGRGHRRLLPPATRRHQVYDLAADRWRAGPSLPARRYAAAAASAPDGALHVAGGIGRRWLAERTLARHDVLDRGGWTVGPPLPAARWHAALAADSTGRLVLAGGRIEGAATASVLVLTPAGWRAAAALPQPYPEPVAWPAGRAVEVAGLTDGAVVAASLPAPETFEVCVPES